MQNDSVVIWYLEVYRYILLYSLYSMIYIMLFQRIGVTKGTRYSETYISYMINVSIILCTYDCY